MLSIKYYTVIKKECVGTATSWIDLKEIMLSERSHTQKSTFIYNSRKFNLNYSDG